VTDADGHAATPSPNPDGGAEGRLIHGRYRLGPVIGRGGMATIHRAMDDRMGRAIAVKLLRPEVLADADLAQRFRREALAATVLRHPNIVACLDTGTDDGQPFLVMELVEGEDLAARLRRSGRLAPWQIARIGLDVARGLGVAHQRGIVHRDVKPGNILLAADGRAMVTDFGIARLAADAEASMPGTTLGSVHYFSPEQARGATTTPASDVYSLGLVLYEALTGQRAWSGDTTDAIALARVGAVPTPPRAIRPEIPADLEAVVIRALAPDAGDRYPNGTSIAAALAAIVEAPASTIETTSIPVRPATTPAGGAERPGAAPPLVPAGAGASAGGLARSVPAAGLGRGSLARPTTGALVALLAVGGIAVGILAVLAIPGGGSNGGLGGIARSPAPTRTPTPAPSAIATPEPTPTPDATAEPTADPTPARTRAPGQTAPDLCESFFGLPCGLHAGRYAPAAFQPAFDLRLGDGWSAATNQPQLVSLTRDEGALLVASGVSTDDTPPRGARDLIEALVVTDGVSATRPAKVKIDKHKGFSTDLSALDGRAVRLFSNAAFGYDLQPGRTTRIVALDVGDAVVVLVIEPSDRSTLPDLLATADDVAASIRFQ
jgi:serine/threonine-protein kinase